MIKKYKTAIILFFIIILGFSLRIYNIFWDQGFYFHPDERAIMLAVVPLHMPSSIQEFLSPGSPLNTHFFAYGNFPMYLLKIISSLAGVFNPLFATYSQMYQIARPISALFDTLTILLIYFICKKMFSRHVGMLSALVYSCSVLPIQLSHFYAVDTILTFFTTLTMLLLLMFYEKPGIKKAMLVGISFAFALSTKASAIPLIISVVAAVCVDFILLFLKQPHKPKHYLPHLPAFILKLTKDFFFIFLTAFLFFVLLQPYAAIDSKSFIVQNLLQSQMTRDAFIFPYTLQYVGKVPYLYELKNIFFWGLGPVYSLFAALGFVYFSYLVFQKGKRAAIHKEIILFSFFAVYFIVVGHFAVGFIRYMLPLYPFFAILAGLSISLIYSILKKHITAVILFTLFFIFTLLVYPISFLTIYTKPNTRVLASDWILKNIPSGKTIALEHWDDALPVYGIQNYNVQTLELYNPDYDPVKWQKINSQLEQSDYIVLASPRLYRFLPHLTDCTRLPSFRCYPQTAEYYRQLFNGELGFKKVADFESLPTIPFTHIVIDDSNADEAFSVYDHPHVIIFKKY